MFASDETRDGSPRWRASIVVPPRANVSTMLAIDVSLADGSPAAGVFSVAGCALPLSGGRAEMAFGQFLAGIRNATVSLDGGTETVPGHLLFF